MHILVSLTFATGTLLVFLSLTGAGRHGRPRASAAARFAPLLRRSGAGEVGARELALMSLTSAVAAAVAAQLLLGWPVFSAASAAVALLLPAWYLRQRSERRRAALEEGVAEAVDALRDAARVGIGLEEALRALGRTGPLALRPVFREVDRDLRLSGFEAALARARERVDVPAFDTPAVALLMAYRIGGRNLTVVLDGLSHSVRGGVRTRREVRAAQAQNLLSARVIAALPLVLIVAIRATNPGYLEVFSSPGGQAVLAFCLLSVAAGYAAMLRATALPEQGRLLR